MTKGKLVEQIRLQLGEPRVEDEEIEIYLGQVVNSLFKTEFMSVTLPSGETTPSNAVIATYDGILVEKYKNRSRAKLPVNPIRMFRNMGVYHVGPDDNLECQYIPIPQGQGSMIKSQKLLNELIATGYEVHDNYVEFTNDLTGQKVLMRLVIMDVDKYGPYDQLPIPADLEGVVVEKVLQMFTQKQPQDKIADMSSQPTKL
jgi:hypothetical protein